MNIQNEIIKDLICWIEKNLDKPLFISCISKRSGFSKGHIQRMFSQVTGVSLGEYVRKRRLYLAAAELLNTDKKILEVALQFGYSDQQAFTRVFKYYYHTTPSKWRALYRKKH